MLREQQVLTAQLEHPGDDLTKVRLLRQRAATGEPFGAGCFIREADAYSGHPEDLVRDHALGMDLGEGKGKSWLFCSPAIYDDSPGGPRRKLNARPGAGDMCRWNPDSAKMLILGPDKKPVGAYRRTLTYVRRINNPPGCRKKYRHKSLGWIMVEIGLEQHQAGQQLVLCEVHRSRQACSLPGGDDPCSAPPSPQSLLSPLQGPQSSSSPLTWLQSSSLPPQPQSSSSPLTRLQSSSLAPQPQSSSSLPRTPQSSSSPSRPRPPQSLLSPLQGPQSSSSPLTRLQSSSLAPQPQSSSSLPRTPQSSSSPSRPRPPQPSSSPWPPPPPPQSSWSPPSLNLSLSPPSSSLPQPPSYLSSRLRSSPSPELPLSPSSSPHPLSCDSKELKFETKLEYDLDCQPGSISPELNSPLGPSCDSKELKFETKLEYDLDWQPGSISPELKHARCWPMGGRRSGCGVAIVKKTSVAPATLVMKFGGSLTQSADGVKEVANLISSFPDGGSENPVVVLSAIGNTNVNLLVAARKALSCDPQEASAIHELVITKELHLRMIHDLGLDRSIISGLFRELENIFMDITETKEMTAKTRDHLGSFGEGMSTIIVSAYLNKLGEEAGQMATLVKDFYKVHQYLAIAEKKLEELKSELTLLEFMGKEWKSDDVNTCGRGGSDLTMTTIGRELGSREIQVWKDVDGVLTCDPKVCGNAKPVPYLTFDEADELGLFDPKSMQPAMEGGIPIIVKNLFNPQAPGTMITKRKGMSKSVLTSIVLRSNILVLTIESTRKLDQPVFIGTSFSTLGNLGIYVDCVDISEGKISLIVVPPKYSSHELVRQEIDNVVEELQKFAVVTHLQYRSVIMLIGSNTQMSSNILVKAVNVLRSNNVEVQKFSQGSSEVMKVSLVVDTNKGEDCVRALHSAFFENSPAAAACSGDKRKADDEHPEAPPGVCQELTDAKRCFLQEFERGLLSENNDPMSVGADNLGHHYKMFEDIINEDRRESIGVDDDRNLADLFAGIPPIVEAEDDLPEPIGVSDGGDFAGMPPIAEESIGVDDNRDLADLFAGIPPIVEVEDDLPETIGVSDGGDFAGMPPIAEECLQEPTGLTVDDYLLEPLGDDVGGDWATRVFGGEAEERQGLQEMAGCSTSDMPPIAEECLQEPTGLNVDDYLLEPLGDDVGGDWATRVFGGEAEERQGLQEMAGCSTSDMPPIAEECLQEPTGLTVDDYLLEPLGEDVGGDWAPRVFGGEAEERQGLQEMAGCSTEPRRFREEESTDTNCSAKPSRLGSGDDDDSIDDSQYYCLDFPDGAPGDEIWRPGQ